jgi:hypothetical protein
VNVDPTLVPLSDLKEGDFFDDSLLRGEPSRTTVFRVTMIRAKTVLADSVAGLRQSFSKRHRVRSATAELFQQLQASEPVKREPRPYGADKEDVAMPAATLRRGRARRGRAG